MVKPHDQRLQSIFLDEVIERPRAVLAAAERHEAVIVALAPILLDQRIEFGLLRRPINSAFDLLLRTDVAGALGIEGDGFVRFRESAGVAAFHDT